MFNMRLYSEGLFFSVGKTVVKDLTMREMKSSSETQTIKLKNSSFSDLFIAISSLPRLLPAVFLMVGLCQVAINGRDL